MAIVTNNNLTRGISGMIGNSLIFKTWNGKTFVYAKPRRPQKESLKQKENRSKFKEATLFAKTMMNDSVKKAEYVRKAKNLNLPNAYTAAITEYMRKPEIKIVASSTYIDKRGQAIEGNVIKMGFEIEEVEVETLDQKEKVIEVGKATKKGSTELICRTTSILQDIGNHKSPIEVRGRADDFYEKNIIIKPSLKN